MTKVKICGIDDIETALKVSGEGADFIGLQVKLNHARNPVSISEAKKIIAHLGSKTQSVIVTSETKEKELLEIMEGTGSKILQCHASAEVISNLKKALKIKIFRVISVENENSIEEARKYFGVADGLVLDSAQGAQKGGTGKTHDWEISKMITEEGKKFRTKIMLAGGLNPQNVKDAIRTVNPNAVDVSSGVANEDRTKNINLVRELIKEAM